MMFDQDRIGRCDFLDVLEEAAIRKTPVAVTLRAGESFIDSVRDVVTESGEDYVLFLAHGRVAVSDIAQVTRAKPGELT